MACALPAADILAMCLELVDDDLAASIGAVMRRLADVEDASRSWPGLPQEVVLHGALFWLGIELQAIPSDGLVWPLPLDGVALRDWAAPMLARGSAYFNDEGESWGAAGAAALRCNQRLMALLGGAPAISPAALRCELDALGLARLAERHVCTLWAEPNACPLTHCWRRG
jgi:hypothetical protein